MGTMSTNGSDLRYDPEFVATLNDSELVGVVAHEVMHCAMRHMYRASGREMKQWNMACDHAINPLLTSSGFTLPQGALIDPRFAGMSAEAIYAQIEKDKQEQEDKNEDQEQEQEGGDTPSSTGEFGAPDDDAASGDQEQDGNGDENGSEGEAPTPRMSETDWEIATEQATAVAMKRGHIGADMQREVALNRANDPNWRDVLREFVQQVIPSDYSWQRPNRRFISGGLYLPGVVREGTPRIVVAIDTSGSITQDILNIFAGEMSAILNECSPERIDVVYCDAEVKAEQSFVPGDELTAKTLQPKGGGGTRFQPVFDHVAAQNEDPAALVYFTDLEGDEPIEPAYPVLWVVPEWISKAKPLFGSHVKLTKY